jgi:hypothetical protein
VFPILCCDSGSGFCLNSWRLEVWEIDPVFGGYFCVLRLSIFRSCV